MNRKSYYKYHQPVMVRWYFSSQNKNCTGATGGGVKMKIRVKHDFYDKEHDLKLRKKNEIMEVKEDRGKELISLNLAEEMEAEKEVRKEAAK